MSLRKQLWIAVGVLVGLSFILGFLVSGHSARSYYQEQLALKNSDNANSLALTLSQQGDDITLIELSISAQFDTGHYRKIELIGVDGQPLVSRVFKGAEATVPGWFRSLIDFEIPQGVAQVQAGWKPLGTLYLESHSDYALAALWSSTVRLFLLLLAVAIICGVIGSYLLSRITRPLDTVVEQAEAIGERRFLVGEEPTTEEFSRLVKAMNRLSERVKGMLEDEARRLEVIRISSQTDSLTGIANRKYFLDSLDTALHSKQADNCAVLVMRIYDLVGMNNRHGRKGTDQWLVKQVRGLESVLENEGRLFGDALLGRLNASELAILVYETESLPELCDVISTHLTSEADTEDSTPFPFALGASYCQSNELVAGLMARLDDLLVTSESAQSEQFIQPDLDVGASPLGSPDEWREALNKALEEGQVNSVMYPTLTTAGTLLHQEMMMQVSIGGVSYSAGRVIAWARRIHLLSRLDVTMVNQAVNQASAKGEPVAVNLSEDSLLEPGVFLEIAERLGELPRHTAELISFEINEKVALAHTELFSLFVAGVRRFGVKVGLQAVGPGIARLKGIEKMGLDYFKVDAVLIQRINEAEIRDIVERVSSLGRSLGAIIIAEGVETPMQLEQISELGFQGATGPQIRLY